METEGGAVDSNEAREHIASFQQARQASHSASWIDLPSWFLPLVGLLPPGFVWWFSSFNDNAGALESSILRAGAIVMAIIAGGALVAGVRWQRQNLSVKALPPIKGGPTSKWMVLFNLSIVFPSNAIILHLIADNDLYQPYLFGGLLYLWYLVVPGYFWRRHGRAIRERAV